MKSRTTIKTRLLALVLTVLMTVGVLPFSIFAIGNAENTDGKLETENAIYNAPTPQELVETVYNSDAKYWKPIYLSDGMTTAMAGKTGRQTHYYGASYLEADANRTTGVSPVVIGDVISFARVDSYVNNGSTVDCTNSNVWGKAGTAAWINNSGVRHNGGEVKNKIWSKNMAGLDTAITFEIKPNVTSGAGKAGIFAGAQSGSTGDQPVHCILIIEADGNGNFILKSQNGEEITALPTDKFTKIQVLFDFGGETLTTAANSYTVFVDGVLMASSTFTTDAALAGLYNAQTQWNTDGGTSYHNGLSFQSINFSAGTVVYDVKNIGIYNYDDTPDDNDITNAKRGIAIDIAYYNDFNNHQDSSYTADGNTSTDKGKLAGTTAFINDRGIGSPSHKHVDDGNVGYAFQFSGTRRNFSLQLQSNNAKIAKNSGKSFAILGEYKLGSTVVGDGQLIYGFSKGVSTNYVFCPVWAKSTGELYLIKDEWDGGNAGSDGAVFVQNSKGFDVADTSNLIGKLSADYFTHVGIFANWEENYYEVYVDGVNVSGKRVIISDAMKAKFATDNGSVYPNGFALTCVSQYTHATTGDNLVMDNFMVYFANEYYNIGGKKYDSAITAEDLTLNSSLVNNAYKSDASYWQKFSTHVTDQRNGTKDNGNGSWTVPKSGDAQYLVTYSASAAPNTKGFWDAGLAGVDVKTSFELTLDNSSTAGGLGRIGVWMPVSANGGAGHPIIMITPVDKGGSKVFELAWPNAAGNAAATKFAEIPADTKVKVDIIFDLSLTNDMYYVFINGAYVGGNSIFNGKTSYWEKITYQQNLINGFRNAEPDKAVGDGLIFDGLRFYSNQAVEMVVGNLNMYHYDDDADGSVTDSARKANVSAPVLKHYQDFDAIAEGTMSAKPNSLLGGGTQASYKSGVAVVDDGRGGKALTTTGSGDIYYEVYPAASSGTNFVTSMDIKLTTMPTENLCLFNGCAYNANAGSYGRDFNLAMLYLDKSGNVWVARKTDATSSGVLINHYSDATSYFTQKVATLNTIDYTNLAIAVNVAENTYKVYVNGVAVTDDLQLLCDSDLELLKGTTNFSNGFGLTHRRFAVRPYMLVDNVAVYYADDILYNKINKSPLNGYFKDGDNYFCYDNGQIVTNFTSADGLITTGADGIVKHDGAAVTNMRSIYKYVGNDIVPVDGKFSGVYSATKSGAYYCYGADKILIKNKTVDMAEVIVGSDLTKPTGFKIDANGVATPLNGMHVVDGGSTYFYVNGVRAMGFVTTDDGVFFINSDYTFFAGQKTVDGKTYFFDATTGEGELLNGVFADLEDANTPDRYYVDGVYQTGLITVGDTKYFADAVGVLQTAICTDPVSGNDYFFYENGANKYQMAIGVSIVYRGSILTIGNDGVINPDRDKVYGQWTEVDGVWYYSDASGNIQTGLAYIEVGYDQNEGGYYFFDNNGLMVKDEFVSVYGTTMYFGEDGVAPNGVVEVGSEYRHFINGVAPNGVTEVIQDGYMFSFNNGILTDMKALDADSPEVLLNVFKDGRKDSFYFNTDDNGVLSILFTNYPCYKFTVYLAGTATKLEPEQDGRYVLEATKSYDVRYEALEHTFGTEAVETVEATCGKDGYKVYTCTVLGCVATQRETVAATGEHIYGETADLVVVAPTCMKEGLGYAYCTECGSYEKTTVIIPVNPDAHSFGAWTEVGATCSTDGYKYRECQHGCGTFESEILEATGAHIKGALTTVEATCVKEGSHTWACANPECDYKFVEIIPIDYNNHVHGNANGTLDSYDEPEVYYFELFQVVKESTCMENGYATYRCYDCGGFVYDVTIALDPDNHHFNPGDAYGNNGSEYLAILDADGNVIERVEIVNGEVLVNGTKVADADADATNDREEMLSYSDMVCGYAEYAEWRIDCRNGCVNPDDPATDAANDAIVYYTTVGEVEGSFMHKFDLTTKYSTSDKLDPLYGYHYYLCQQCGKASGITVHTFTYTDNGDGTHTATCDCTDETTGLAYSEIFDCEYENKSDSTGHWAECELCGNIKDSDVHTYIDSDDGVKHYLTCACGYQIEHHMSAICHKDATCCETGYSDYMDCDECDYTAGKEIIPVIPHSFSGQYASDVTGHWYVCDNTCNGTQCTFTYSFTVHSFVTVPAVDATCTTEGHSEYQLCTECGYELGKAVEPALEHDVAGVAYSYDDEQHWQICNRCHERVIGNHGFGTLIEDENGTKQCGECLYIKTNYEFTWWYALGLDRVDVEGHYYYTYGNTVDAIVEIQGNYYYFDANGYLVMIGDTGVSNDNVMVDNGIFDKIYFMGDTHGAIVEAVLTVADGYTYYIDNSQYAEGWQTLEDGKDYFFNTKLAGELVVDAPEYALVKGANGTITALNLAGDAKILVNVDTNGARNLGLVDNGDGTYSYYLDGAAGKLTGRIEDNYYNVGNVYFAKADGALYGGEWTSVDGVYYSFDVTDYFVTAWHKNETATIEIEGVPTTIYTNGEGKRITNGWYETKGVGGRYIDNGEMITDRDNIYIEDTYYSIDANGIVSYYNGWLDDAHYIASGMIVKSRFEEIGGNKYYFDGEGVLVKASAGTTIKVVIDSWVYEIDENGYAVQFTGDGWVQFIDANGKVSAAMIGYCTASTGIIKAQALTIVDTTYVFDANGVLVRSESNYECNGVYYVIDADGKATVKDEDDGE